MRCRLAYLQRSGERRSASDADEDALLLREVARALHRIRTVDRHDLINELQANRVFRELGNEVRAPALHQVRTEERMAPRRRTVGPARLRDAAAEELRVVGLAHDDLGLRPLLAQHARDALQCATRAEPRDPVIELLALEGFENLWRRGARVHVGIGLVLELPAQEPAMRLGELDRLGEHATALERCRRQHHLRAEKAHHLAPLDAEVFRHGHHQRVALLRAHHGEADTRVAAGCLDDGLAWAQRAALFGVFDNTERQAVFDRAHAD